MQVEQVIQVVGPPASSPSQEGTYRTGTIKYPEG